MVKFEMWLTERLVAEVNRLLIEVGEESIPMLKLKPSIKDPSSMFHGILNGYAREVKIQSRYGGIRNPPAVAHNKIRHDLTNYDDIRDALTDGVRSGGLDRCRAADIRKQVADLFYELCKTIIAQLPPQFTIRGADAATITHRDLLAANDSYMRRESQDIAAEKSRCGPPRRP